MEDYRPFRHQPGLDVQQARKVDVFFSNTVVSGLITFKRHNIRILPLLMARIHKLSSTNEVVKWYQQQHLALFSNERIT